MQFPRRRANNWISTFLEYADASEAPTEMLFWTAISTLAGATRRRCLLDQGHYTYTSNHYVILVAPPGIVAKSTTADIGMRLLRGVEDVKFGPDVVTWQALIENLANSRVDYQTLETGDFTSACELTISSSEFGNLIDPSNREMVDAYVNLWDSKEGPFSKQTKTSGSDHIISPWVNIIACTTPAWISGTFPEYMIGGGFTSRCIFIFAEKKRKLVPYPDEVQPANMNELRIALIADLKHISTLEGKFILSKEARDIGREFYIDLWTNPNQEIDMQRFGGSVARKQAHVHKLAMMLSISESDSLTITAEHMNIAIREISKTERTLHRVFDLIGKTTESSLATVVLSTCERVGPMPRSELYARLMGRFGAVEIKKGLDTCLAAKAINLVQIGDDVVLITTAWREAQKSSSSAEKPAA